MPDQGQVGNKIRECTRPVQSKYWSFIRSGASLALTESADYLHAETCPNRYNHANLTSIHRSWAFHKSESLFYWNSYHFEGIAGVGSGYEKFSDSRMPLKKFYTWSHALCKPRGVPQIPICASRGLISFARSGKFRSEDSGILMVCGGQFSPLQTLLNVLFGETNQPKSVMS